MQTDFFLDSIYVIISNRQLHHLAFYQSNFFLTFSPNILYREKNRKGQTM